MATPYNTVPHRERVFQNWKTSTFSFLSFLLKGSRVGPVDRVRVHSWTISIPHCINDQRLVIDLSISIGWWIKGVNLWHESFFNKLSCILIHVRQKLSLSDGFVSKWSTFEMIVVENPWISPFPILDRLWCIFLVLRLSRSNCSGKTWQWNYKSYSSRENKDHT